MEPRENAPLSHEEMLAESIRRAQEAIDATTDLNSLVRREYLKSVIEVLSRLSPAAIVRHYENTKGIKFYRTHAELTSAIRTKYPDVQIGIGKVFKGAFDRDGILHLNGGGKLYGRTASLQEFYAHEITHSIDGNGHDFSSTWKWIEAWIAERNKGYFGPVGMKMPAEGFAEFGQMVLGTGITRDQVMELLPECLKIWEGNGLWKNTKKT